MIRRLHWRKGPIDKKEMKRLNGNTKYHLACFLYKLLLLFISSFLLFPSHIKRIILCIVYSDDHQPTFVHPSLKEENSQPSYVIDVDPISSLQPAHKYEHYIQIIVEFNQPSDLEEIKTNSKPSQISAPYTIKNKPCHQPVNSHVQTATFQAHIRNKLCKPLRIPYHLNPYPLDFCEYLPRFSGEDYVLAEKHLEAFHNFIDNFEMVHEDVVLNL